jgi:hypothetical protein
MPPTPFESLTYLEDVYAALFALLQTATYSGGLAMRFSQRTLVPPDEVPVANSPALFLVPGPMHVEQREFALAKWILTGIIIVYVRGDSEVPNPNPLPASLVNDVIWGIATTLATTQPPYQKQTLGGLVYHTWLEGDVTMEIGSEQLVIYLPVYMEAGPVG